MLDITKASAGSGKTFRLARTYIDLLLCLQGRNRHRHILAVTFTKKATAEMKNRIVEELSLLAHGGKSAHKDYLMERHALSAEQLQEKSQNILYDLLQDYSAFAVSTIDSFFQRIIRSFSRELNLPGSYNLELDGKHILQEAVDNFFYHLSADPHDLTVQTLTDLIRTRISEDKNSSIKDEVLSLSKELSKEEYMAHQKELEAVLQDKEKVLAYRRLLMQKKASCLQQCRQIEESFMQILSSHMLEESDFSRGVQVFKPFHWTDKEIIDKKGSVGTGFLKLVNEGTEGLVKAADKKNPARYAELTAAGEAVRSLAHELLGLQRRVLPEIVAVLEKLPYLSLLADVSEKIREKNAELSRLPIADTNRLLNDVVRENEEAPFVYDKIGTRIYHYLIDEFQDTSQMQWDNFRPLLRESLATDLYNLIVGDVKQSIYRFRNSDYNLMQSQLDADFSPKQLQHETLGDNWRSDEQVVLTNNEVFRLLCQAEDEEFNMLLDGAFPTMQHKIEQVYSSLEQRPQKKKEKGYVRMEFVPVAKTKERHEAVLDALPDLLRDIQQRNIPLGRVAFLLRYSKDIREVAQKLTEAGFAVMSNEGLLLTAAREVRLIISLLHNFLTPEDKIWQVQTRYEYLLLQGYPTDKALEQASALATVFDTEQQATLADIARMPLYDQVQALAGLFRLDEEDKTKPYIQSLLDCVYRYIGKYQADLYSFLQWWEEKAEGLSVAASESHSAVQLLTVHKSKGLEYDVVIVPFCDWEKGSAIGQLKQPLLWVEPKGVVAEDCPLPLLPIQYSKDLADTAFAEDYFKELQNAYLDNLNLTYVAFTRAKRELYVYAPAYNTPNAKGEITDKTDTIGAMLHKVLEQNGQLTGENIYERGEKVRNGKVAEEVKVEENKRLSAPLGKRLQVKLSSHDYFGEEDRFTDLSRPVNLGSIMHRILQQVDRVGDEEKELQRLIESGDVTVHDAEILHDELLKFRELIADRDWFSGQYHALNEREILLPDGSNRRPDRVLLQDSHAIVIDYKFGTIERVSYARQVSEYMSLLRQMGYTVEGYLCYVNLQKIVEVE